MAFSNSRTFPGQLCAGNTANAASLKVASRPRNSLPSCAAKCLASKTMSLSRARKGGISRGNTAKRKNRSRRNSPLSTAAFKSRFVAATTRTSTGTGARPPIRSTTFSSITRNSFPCTASGSSPISSRKTVPLEASSNFPSRRSPAPVKAPRSWPNNSFSMSVSGMAAQLMATKGLSRLPER